jgi:cytochrome b involved in lipid metabolism
MSDERLQRIAEIEINGKKYDLAKNGQFRLVEAKGKDAYGSQVFQVVSYRHYSSDILALYVDGLLDLLGDALTRLQTQRDSRLGRGENGD